MKDSKRYTIITGISVNDEKVWFKMCPSVLIYDKGQHLYILSLET